MDALEFINIVVPEHDRSSCSDDNLYNTPYINNGKVEQSRCLRCSYLQVINNEYEYNDHENLTDEQVKEIIYNYFKTN